MVIGKCWTWKNLKVAKPKLVLNIGMEKNDTMEIWPKQNPENLAQMMIVNELLFSFVEL